MKSVSIIGAGAAGCFCALLLKRRVPFLQVQVFESGKKALAKVAITGGGRCNLTNTFQEIRSLKEAYPRGEQLVKRAFCQFDNVQLMQWFEGEGVPLVVQPDQCVFPKSQDAMQIVNTLLRGMEKAGVQLRLNHRVREIAAEGDGYRITFADTAQKEVHSDIVIVTTGGCPKAEGLSFLSPMALKIETPVPSLFSFNIQGMSEWMGIVVDSVSVALAGTKFRAQGALLITHWGMSGPAILKLSSYAARHLAEVGYKACLVVNWLGETGEEEARALLSDMQQTQGAKQIGNTHVPQLSSRFWQGLLKRSGINPEQRWSEVGRKQMNRLLSVLLSDVYEVEGQSRHKEEFVTCGGVSLSNLNLNTLEVKQHPGLFLAGEVLDVDAITGGFNLQAAWSMGYVIANHLSASMQ
ncbi:MAG: aminoacetone oxidase family FAD-binding enzyme [Bacteroidales bacterium]|nr:aminoacetone oxidase family FAD-binding enzyme [Bacteroidales bacterium]